MQTVNAYTFILYAYLFSGDGNLCGEVDTSKSDV